MMRLKKALAICVIAGSMCTATGANAQTFGLNSVGMIGVTNNGFDPLFLHPLEFSGSVTGEYVEASASQSFNGQNQNGDFGTMDFQGFGSASAQYGQLKTYGYGMLENSFYNSENPIYFNSDTREVDPNGTPDRFVAFGQAQYEDYFQYSSPSGNINAGVKVDFWYYIHGTLNGDSAFHSILVENDGDIDYIQLESDGGIQNINQVWTSKKFTIGADLALQHRATLVSQFDNISTANWDDNSLVEGTSDFGSTVILGGMHLYDENDNLISDWTMTALSGTDYQAVPEPTTMVILGIGAFAALKCRKF